MGGNTPHCPFLLAMAGRSREKKQAAGAAIVRRAAKIIIEGGVPLQGTIRIKGAKNAALPILAATLLTDKEVALKEVPPLEDIKIMSLLLRQLGVEIHCDEQNNERYFVYAHRLHSFTAPPGPVRCMRASFLVAGPLLARLGRVRISRPGGCAIGTRPIDLHLKGLTAMGADFSLEDGFIMLEARRLRGEQIYLDYPSVGATENIMMAACLAEGTTVIENAAAEPEVVDLANFLNSLGARVFGAGTSVIRVEGVNALAGSSYTVIPDRIEAGTFMLAAAITGGSVLLQNVLPQHLKSLMAKLKETGMRVEMPEGDKVLVEAPQRPQAVDIQTLPYPGFPTDLQPQTMAFLSIAQGASVITETVFEKRFRHVEELCRMGADIYVDGRIAVIKGREYLRGAVVKAPDLRAAAALVLAGLAARGTTKLYGLQHLDRGYASLEKRLRSLGARIWRV